MLVALILYFAFNLSYTGIMFMATKQDGNSADRFIILALLLFFGFPIFIGVMLAQIDENIN